MALPNKNIWLIAVAVALLIGAILWMIAGGKVTPVDEAEEMEEEEQMEEEQMEEGASTSETRLDEQNDSGQSGLAVLVDGGDGTTLVTLTATSLAGPQPAHIHSGTCEDLGGVVYPLNSVVDGSSQTTVNASLADLLEGTFAINIHLSVEQADVYTACGNI